MNKIKKMRTLMEGVNKGLTESVDEIIPVQLLDNVTDISSSEWEKSNIDYETLEDYIGKRGDAELAVDNGDWRKNYYDVSFPDGYTLIALSGIHIEQL